MMNELSEAKNNITTLHITASPTVAGNLFHTRRLTKLKYDVAMFPLSISCFAVPKSLEMNEIERCIKQEISTLYHESIRDFANIQLKKYHKIIVWHGKDAESLLLFYFMCYVLLNNTNLYHVDYKEEPLTPEYCENALKHCCKLTMFQYNKIRTIYSKILETDGIPKVAKGWQIVLTDREYWNKFVLRHITKEPRYIKEVVEKCLGMRSIGCRFPYEFYLKLVLELIEERKVMPIKVQTQPNQVLEEAMKTGLFKSIREYKKYNSPLKIGDFCNFGKEYIYDGIDLCKCYNFQLIKK